MQSPSSKAYALRGRYEIRGRLSKGHTAKVYVAARKLGMMQRVRGESNAEVAIKVADMRSQGDKEAWMAEVQMLRKVQQLPNCLQLVEAFADESHAYIVMERCEYSLYQSLIAKPHLTECTYADVLTQVLQGLEAIHARGIVHRDIKPDNIMCTGSAMCAKLCDFGLATACSMKRNNGKLEGVFGTPPYMPPEMLRGELYDAKADMWSVGAMMYVLMLGQYPYRPFRRSPGQEKVQDMKDAIRKGVPEPTFRPPKSLMASGLSLLGENVLRSLLMRKPEERPTAVKIAKHPWLKMRTPSLQPPAGSAKRAALEPMLHAAVCLGVFDGVDASQQSAWEVGRKQTTQVSSEATTAPGCSRCDSLQSVQHCSTSSEIIQI